MGSECSLDPKTRGAGSRHLWCVRMAVSRLRLGNICRLLEITVTVTQILSRQYRVVFQILTQAELSLVDSRLQNAGTNCQTVELKATRSIRKRG